MSRLPPTQRNTSRQPVRQEGHASPQRLSTPLLCWQMPADVEFRKCMWGTIIKSIYEDLLVIPSKVATVTRTHLVKKRERNRICIHFVSIQIVSTYVPRKYNIILKITLLFTVISHATGRTWVEIFWNKNTHSWKTMSTVGSDTHKFLRHDNENNKKQLIKELKLQRSFKKKYLEIDPSKRG